MKIIIFLAVICLFSINSFAAVKTWDGGGADDNWGTAANWVGDIAPVVGDDLIFPVNAAKFSTNNNIGVLLTTYRSITIEGGNYTIGGNGLRLTNGLRVNAGTQTINTIVNLGEAQTFFAGENSITTIAALSLLNFPLTFDGGGVFFIGVITGSGNVTKNGLGAVLVASASNFSGAIFVNGGAFVLDANIPNSPVTVNATETFNGIEFDLDNFGLSGFVGTGTVGRTTVTSGIISSGSITSPTGILNITNGLTIGANGIYLNKIGGATAGADGYDQLNVTGAVNLNNARLEVVPLGVFGFGDFRPAIGDTFVIIKNDGTDAVNGTFLNALEGTTFGAALNTAYRITYRGGDGNDVAITRVNRAAFDFDGDGRADVSVFRPMGGFWYELLSRNGNFASQQFGASEDRIVPADYDGDARTDIAVFRPSNGVWYQLRSSDNTFNAVQFGTNGDIPVPNDYDGDGKADIAVFRPSNGTWYQLISIGNQFLARQFGISTDKPLVGDFNGDGIGDLAVYRNGTWYLSESPGGIFRSVQFGLATDTPTPADYDGDGATDISVFRPSNGVWYRLNSGSNNSFASVQFGVAEDKPVPADYDGDGKSDVAVFRPSNGVWYLLRSTAGFSAVSFGQTGDKPIPNAFIP
ncbi:MAG TPA: VCBS repeat-containing protein [Pyrinomonadaceae bacterium]|nr:VCBS repeat-containing protein [Pyrinomonadaceae bacterium]